MSPSYWVRRRRNPPNQMLGGGSTSRLVGEPGAVLKLVFKNAIHHRLGFCCRLYPRAPLLMNPLGNISFWAGELIRKTGNESQT